MKKAKGKKGNKAIIGAAIAIVIVIISLILNKNGTMDSMLDDAAQTTTKQTSADTADMTTTEPAVSGNLLDAYFIDIGQGDCALLVSDGMSMLIDSGEDEYADEVIRTVSDYGISTLDYVVVTHAHSDHMGSMADVISAIDVKNIIISEPCEDSSLTATYEKFIDAMEASSAAIILAEPDYTFSFGKADCTILSPFNVDSSNENNNSVVMHVTAGETSFLLTGDMEKSVEKQIMENYPLLDIDILKVGHHGSSTSSYKKFIAQISPEVAVISCGLNNRYNHPSEKTLETLDENNVKYYRTDICGTVSVHCTQDGYTLEMKEQ